MRLRQWSFALAFLVGFFPVPIAAQVEALHTAPQTGGMQSLVAEYPARRVVVLDSTKLIANQTVFSPAAERTLQAEMSQTKRYALIGAGIGAVAGGTFFHVQFADRWNESGGAEYGPPISWAYGAFALAGGALGALVGYAVAPQ